MDTDKDVNATLSSLYNEYERQFRHLFRNDRETLFSMAKAYTPDLTDDATKADCATIIMQNSRLAKRINALEQVRGVDKCNYIIRNNRNHAKTRRTASTPVLSGGV